MRRTSRGFGEEVRVVTLRAEDRDLHFFQRYPVPPQNTGLVNAAQSGFLAPLIMSFLGVNAFSADRFRGGPTGSRS
jgi:hypothetical protein